MRNYQLSKLSSKYSAYTRFDIFLCQQNDCLSLKTLTRPPLSCDWYTMPYTCIYIMYSIKLTRHEYAISYDSLSPINVSIFLRLTLLRIIYRWSMYTIKYTKYYSSCGATFVYLYECVYINIYARSWKITSKELIFLNATFYAII